MGGKDELSFDYLWKNLRDAPAPAAESEAIKFTGDTTVAEANLWGVGFFDLGIVTHLVDEDSKTVVNVTSGDHWLNPGIAALSLEEHDGNYVLVVRGIGNGGFNFANEWFADDVWQPIADNILKDTIYEMIYSRDRDNHDMLSPDILNNLLNTPPPPPPAPDPIFDFNFNFDFNLNLDDLSYLSGFTI